MRAPPAARILVGMKTKRILIATGAVLCAGAAGQALAPSHITPKAAAAPATPAAPADFSPAHAAQDAARADQMSMLTTWDTRSAKGRASGCASWRLDHATFYAIVAHGTGAPWAGIPQAAVDKFMSGVCL